MTKMPITFDPVTTEDYTTLNVNQNIFETLAMIENNETVPLLAVNWFALSDSIFVIQIRDDVYFSNGVLMTVEDVVASLHRAINLSVQAMNPDLTINSITISNENTIHIHGHRIEHIPTLMLNTYIYNADHLSKFDDEYLKNNPLGTGSYFVYLNTPEHIILKKNKFHRHSDINRRSPNVVELLYIPCLEEHYKLLLNNEVDFLLQLPLSAYADVFINNTFRYTELPSNFIFYMMLDANRTSIPNYDLPVNPLHYPKVRQAIAHSLDINRYITNQLLGRANSLVIPAMRNLIGYPGLIEFYRFDPEYSLHLLSEAGFKEGFTLNLRTHQGEFTESLSEFVIESLAQINIEVIVELFESDQFLPSFEISTPPSLITYLSITQSSDNVLASLNTLFTVNSSANLMQNNNSRITDLIYTIFAMNEYDIQIPIMYRALINEIYNEILIIPFFQPFNLFIYRKRISLQNADDFRYTNIKVGR